MNLTRKDRVMLAKLLALAGSTTHDGETVAALRKADALVKSAGATWEDVMMANPIRIFPQHRNPSPAPEERAHVTIASDLLRKGKAFITTWERGFLLSILAYRDLKPKQLETLSLISRKVAIAMANAA